ncbi:fumarylacetoacetate hydrolase family protein [Fulvimarina sp. 2208YS6-2-32]|uniref:Fumarylacetoacetate hydrolase family protein n=1 Tax=Fulvimarina uroteuthidis TaxID=3098149 RepID=A0ABU5I190_9HYPH|nr:fumarylacetoacetate hydrolase family protein [Fulvimarina sp. 2208YS6-2-32]MDY8108986.1 fumarylacetoacetate hydrolase family protein [Fulvimarina sp. 2208YS6-2-32]
MKLVRYGPKGQEKPGLVGDDGTIRDLSGEVRDIAGEVLSEAGLKHLASLDIASLPVVDGTPRLGSPVAGLQKIVAIGLNYSDHAAETGAEPPEEPIVFMKALNALSGPNDDVEMPRNSSALDWEVELAIIIGTKAKYVSKENALAHVAGYAVMNDVSERDFQTKRSGQWTKGKSHDTFGPLGPWLVTKDEIGDVHDLAMELDVNGQARQRGNTNTLIFDVPTVVSYLSQFMTLMPGDVITTGTPPGVGMGMKPPQYLKVGDTMRLSIAGLGEQTQTVVSA